MTDRDSIVAAYHEGVDGIERIAARFSADDWARASGCADWSARDLAGHVLAVAGWWHSWLDRAERGDASPPFRWEDVAQRNAEALSALPDTSGPERIAEFAKSAHTYLERALGAWDLPFGCPPAQFTPSGVTAGVHLGLATAEWNLHAWDLAYARGESHEPASAATIFESLRAVFPIPPMDGDAWRNVLTASGRTP